MGRAVNTASPSGAISTAEYNGTNNVVRGLSADNRLAALKEGSESKEKCKSAEVSKLLDTESTYEEKGSEPGTEVLSTLGPQHTVKLANGTQVEARSHTVYSYNEGAPSEGGPYHLVTKTTDGAQYSEKEADVHTATTSYSGEANLGWKLRKPTSVTTNPGGLNLTRTTTYEASTGNVSETTMPGATGKPIGEFTEYPLLEKHSSDAIVTGPDKNLWFAGGGKIGKITTSGTVTEYSLPEKSSPYVITAGPEKENALWFTDLGTSKIGKITTSGTITTYAIPSGNRALEITAGPDNNLWFTTVSNTIGKITTSGTITQYSVPSGSVPYGITAGPEKENALWFTDSSSSKIGKITTSGTITESALPSGSAPEGITAGPDGNVWYTSSGTAKIGKISKWVGNAHPEPAFESCAAPVHAPPSACQFPKGPVAGACELSTIRLPAKSTALRGAVATEISPSPSLLGHAFVSCVETDYSYLDENALEAAVLLDASHPGATPASLPAMKPLVRHPGIFVAPGWEGEIVGRRIPGAWIVVEENDAVGLSVPVELLESLRATIQQ